MACTYVYLFNFKLLKLKFGKDKHGQVQRRLLSWQYTIFGQKLCIDKNIN